MPGKSRKMQTGRPKMNIRKTILALATCATLVSPALAQQTAAELANEAASNHGYATAALEVVCGGRLTEINPKLRAKLDRLYRENIGLRQYFLKGYEAAAAQGSVNPTTLLTVCLTASNSKWLRLDPAARDLMANNSKKYEEERK
jgi:hypothetical protein